MLPNTYGKHSFRVLLVDRSEETRDLFANLFTSLGYEVETVATVAAALSSVPVFRPDAVFTSIFLPDGSGFELCAQLRRLPETAGARIVAITGYLAADASRLAVEAGFDRYLVKPVQLETILEALAPTAGQLH
jgi:CheY-like chemotaxis protein